MMDGADSTRPLPNLDEDIAPFWQAVREHRFTLFQCKQCGAWYFPAAYCRNHENEPFMGNLAWTEASGRGKVFAYNVHHTAFDPAFKEKLPYVYALIELEEGPMIGSNVVGIEPQKVFVGMPVEVTFEDIREGWALPLFRPRAT